MPCLGVGSSPGVHGMVVTARVGVNAPGPATLGIPLPPLQSSSAALQCVLVQRKGVWTCLSGSPHGCSQPSARLEPAGSPAEVSSIPWKILCHVGSQPPSLYLYWEKDLSSHPGCRVGSALNSMGSCLVRLVGSREHWELLSWCDGTLTACLGWNGAAISVL